MQAGIVHYWTSCLLWNIQTPEGMAGSQLAFNERGRWGGDKGGRDKSTKETLENHHVRGIIFSFVSVYPLHFTIQKKISYSWKQSHKGLMPWLNMDNYSFSTMKFNMFNDTSGYTKAKKWSC